MSAPFDAQFKGYQLTARKLDIMRMAYPQATHAALVTVANETMQTVVNRAPSDTGFLRSSGYMQAKKKSVRFGLGAWYAAIVNGRKSLKTAKPRFFESALEDLFPAFLSRMAALTASYIRQGITEVRPNFPPVPINGDGYTKVRKRASRARRFRLSRSAGVFVVAKKKRGKAGKPRGRT